MLIKVRIKNFAKRPDHWNNEGFMDSYMGRIVEVEDWMLSEKNVHLKNDKRKWIWKPSDFERIDDPNVLFLHHKNKKTVGKK